MSQEPLFPTYNPSRQGAREGARLRDQAIDRVGQANVEFVNFACGKVEELARSQRFFTTDDVWAVIHASGEFVSFTDARAMGAVMKRMQKEGIIAPTDPPRFQRSKRAVCHRNPKLVWESLVC